MAGFSADGDLRLLNSMKLNSKFNTNLQYNHSFDNIDEVICFLQDIVHIGTKLRNRLLSEYAILILGNKIASVTHLKMLINHISKDVHGLVYSDICPDDRQNFGSLQKIMEPRVHDALQKYIVNSEGIIEYIRICQEIISSLYDDDVTPLDRIFRLWRSTFFLRACRLHILNNHNANLNDNFITSNAHMCIELNAKNLIVLTKTFRDAKLDKLFLPTIFNSQPCEETFRKLRSMGTINYTKINFTLLEVIHLIGRIDLMNEIMYFKLGDSDVFFPRNPVKKSNYSIDKLPSNHEIEETISKALIVAMNDAKRFGINIHQNDILNCPLEDIPLNEKPENHNSDTFVDLGIASSSKINECENLKDYSKGHEILDEKSSFVSVVGSRGGKTVRKSSFMNNLSKDKGKLSSDRTRRVQDSSNQRTPYRQLEFVDVSVIDQPVYVANEAIIGDWVVFQNIFDKDAKGFILGNIFSIRYRDGRTNTDKKYLSDFAPVKKNSNEEKSREIELMGSWYQMELNDKAPTFKFIKHSYVCTQYYVANLNRDVIEKDQNESIFLSRKHTKSIINFLQCFEK